MSATFPMTASQTRLFTPQFFGIMKGLACRAGHTFNLKIREGNHLPVENQKPEYLALVLTIEAHFPENHS